MNCIIPYTKEIPFNSKIREITSISLEHEMNINEGEILGNFIVSGEYKAHELSVNKESFEHVLPFSIDLTERVIEDSINFNITDFSYEILNDNTLKVMIEFTVEAEEKEDEETEERDEVFITPVEEIPEEIEIITPREEKLEEEEVVEITPEEIEEVRELIEEKEDSEIKEEEKEIVLEVKPESEVVVTPEKEIERDVASIEMVNETVSKATDTYKTYHIHIVKENENLEMICEMYKSSKSTLEEYNDLNEIVPGDKLIIPEDD